MSTTAEPVQWTLVAYVRSQHPRYSKQHLIATGSYYTLCGVFPPIHTHWGHNHSGQCKRCLARAAAGDYDLQTE